MTEKELKRLSRADLLEMLIDQSVEMQKTKERLQQLEDELCSREIVIDNAGSIAEAAFQLNGVFEAAQASCEQYVENIRAYSERQEDILRWREQESIQRSNAILMDTERRCAAIEAETQRRCAEMELETQNRCAAMIANARSEAAYIQNEASWTLYSPYPAEPVMAETEKPSLWKRRRREKGKAGTRNPAAARRAET